VILRSRHHGDVQLRSGEWGTEHIIPSYGFAGLSSSGVAVTEEAAYGLPAVSNVIRAPAEIVATLPFIVYKDGAARERAEKDWRWGLLHERPSEDVDSYEFWYDLELSLEATQNAFIQKAKTRSKVVECYVIDPHAVKVTWDRETNRRKYEIWQDGTSRPIPADQILHIRGWSPRPGAIAGVSLLTAHRNAIGSALAMNSFEGDYFKRGAVPPFWYTGAANSKQAQEIADMHNARHAGPGNAFKVGSLWGQMDVKSIPISMEDASFVDTKRLSIEDACRIWRWPKELLELSEAPTLDETAWAARFLKFYLLPRLRRIERAFAADDDLFFKSGFAGEFLTAALERADYVTRVRGYKDARQGGWITGNEIRELENYPPVEGGDELLQTPTGSAPNPSADR
jgi:HK97 family phage portal protein